MIIVILILALALRLISLNQSLWFDEAINVMAAHDFGLMDYLTKYSIGDFHPGGYFLILWVWTHLFGFSEIAVRLPSVIFAVLTVYLTYLIGKQLFSKRIGLISSLFLAVAPLDIYYSQEARMYSFAVFAVTFSVYGLIKLIQGTRWSIPLYALSLTFVLYSDYVAYFVLPVHLIYLLVYQKKYWQKFLQAYLLAGLFFLPWLPVFKEQLVNGEQTASQITGWKNVVGGIGLKSLALLPVKTLIGRISFDNKSLYELIVGVVALPYLLVVRKLNKPDAKVWLLLNWLIVPPLLAFLISFYVPVFSYFRLIFILPALYLLVAFGVEKLSEKMSLLVISFMVGASFALSSLYLFFPNFQREDWRGATNFLQQTATNNSLVLFDDNEVQAPFRYYNQGKLLALAGLRVTPIKGNSDLVNLQSRLTNVSTVYLFEYLVEVNDPGRLLEKDLQSLGWKKEITYNFKGVGFIYRYTHPLPDTAHPH